MNFMERHSIKSPGLCTGCTARNLKRGFKYKQERIPILRIYRYFNFNITDLSQRYL